MRVCMIELQEKSAISLAAYLDGIDSFETVADRLIASIHEASAASAVSVYSRLFDDGVLRLRSIVGDEQNSLGASISDTLFQVAQEAVSSYLLKREINDLSELPFIFLKRIQKGSHPAPGDDAVIVHVVDLPKQKEEISEQNQLSFQLKRPMEKAAYTGACAAYLSSYYAKADSDEASEESKKSRLVLNKMRIYLRLLLRHNALIEAEARARMQTDKRIDEVATIYELTQAVDRASINDLFNLIVTKAALVMQAQACSLMLKSSGSDDLHVAAAYGSSTELLEIARSFMGQGTAPQLSESGPLFALDVDSDIASIDRLSGRNAFHGDTSIISLPLTDEWSKTLGVLCIRRNSSNSPFNSFDHRLFSIFAGLASHAIKNAKHYEQLRIKYSELANLSSLTNVISSKLDIDYVLGQFAASLMDAGNFDKCWIYVRDEADLRRGWEIPRLTRGFGEVSPDIFASLDLVHLVEGVAERQLPIYIESRAQAEKEMALCAEAVNSESLYVHPVVVRNQCVGVVAVASDPIDAPIELTAIDLVSTFVQHAGIAIENSRLYQEMKSRVQELNTLYLMSKSLSTSYGLNRTCSLITRFGAQVSKSDISLLILVNERMETFRVQDLFGAPVKIEDIIRFLPDISLSSSEIGKIRESIRFSPIDHLHGPLFGSQWLPLTETMAAIYPRQLITPLISDEALIGYLWLGRKEETAFDHTDEKLIGIVASHAAIVIKSAASYEQSVEQRVLELSALYEVSKKIRSAQTLADTFSSVLNIVRSVVYCDSAVIYGYDKGKLVKTVEYSTGERSDIVSIKTSDKHVSVVEYGASERKALLSADVEQDPRFIVSASAGAVRSLMVIPIVLAEETFGALQVYSASRNLYTEENVKMLSLFTSQAIALYREMRSNTDLNLYTNNILQSIAAGVVALDASGGVVAFNQAAEKILRLDADSVIGLSFETLVSRLDADPKQAQETLRMISTAIRSDGLVERRLLQYYSHSDLGPVLINGCASPFRSGRGDPLGVVFVFEDVAKEVEMEKELQRVGRLAEIGQLAAGIAHELRNPLASIKGAAQVLAENLPSKSMAQHGEFLDIILNEVDILNNLTTEFLDFSRPSLPNRKMIDLKELIDRRLGVLRFEFEHRDVGLNVSYAEKLPLIDADSVMIEQIVNNIVLNALQAMRDGGLLSIEATPSARQLAQGVEVKFTDTGQGIARDKIASIFAPFFTTKTKGMGLGLAIVQKNVDLHGGRISVESELGKGACFILWLPQSAPQLTQERRVLPLHADIEQERRDDPFHIGVNLKK